MPAAATAPSRSVLMFAFPPRVAPAVACGPVCIVPKRYRSRAIDFINKRLFTVCVRRGRVKRAGSPMVKARSRIAAALPRPRKPAAPPVRERILEVAERLFAEHGMSGVGLRAISAEAKVNLASIAYHFGSKDGLLEALFSQRAAPIAEERLRLLAQCYEKTDRPKLEDILEAFLRPALVLGVQPQFGGPAFVKLRARLATEPVALSRKILSKAFDLSSRKFIEAIAAALPGLPRAEVEG